MARPVIEMEGKRFGKLVVIRMAEESLASHTGNKSWLCKCDCGNEITVNGSLLRSGKKTNRGCAPKFNSGRFKKGDGIKDITGQRFGKLTVIRIDRVENKRSYWWVKCECGTIKSVRSDTLKVITSCGCDKKKQDIINLGIIDNHELTNHPVYGIWSAMKNRCENPENRAYKDYGGRGIKICPEWHDIRNFAKWADETGFEAGKNLSIERIDVNGDYCPENCKWIDRRLQSRNRRNTVKLDIDGIIKPLTEWAEIYNIPKHTVYGRFEKGIRNPDDLFYSGNLQMRDCGKE